MRIYIYVDANGRDSMRGAKRTFRAEADRQRRALAAAVPALDALAGAIDRPADSADPWPPRTNTRPPQATRAEALQR
jgi:hypothetical protein